MIPKPLLIVLVVLPLLLLVANCGEDSQPVQQAAPQQAPSQPTAPAASQPQAGAPDQQQTAGKTDAWPYITTDQPVDALAENLTARNFLLIFDGSGSMRESECAGASRKIDVAKRAVTAWSKSVPADANLGLYAFHNQGILTLPLASGNRDTFMQAVDRIDAGGKTPLADAMQYAYTTLTEQGRRQLGYGEYTIVVVTDGIANSIPELQSAVDRILSRTPISIYSIGFCIGERHSLNQPGRTLYKSADNPEQLQEGLREVLAESESFDEREFSK
jgi:Ca-activated chloride channel family protein